jgi:putative ABC transport system ATP-binding protein
VALWRTDRETTTDGGPPIRAVGLRRTFKRGDVEIAAVDGVDFAASAGELVAVMGPSGSGKSTLLHLLGALDRPDAGLVMLGGREISALPERELVLVRRRRLGFLPQFFSLLPTMSALENVALPLLLDGARDARSRAREALAEVGLERRAEHRPAELSGGEQQRVALARALVLRPALVLADEPTGSLDSAGSEEIMDLLAGAARSGQSIVIVTHDQAAASHAGRVVQMADGRLWQRPDAPAATEPVLRGSTRHPLSTPMS